MLEQHLYAKHRGMDPGRELSIIPYAQASRATLDAERDGWHRLILIEDGTALIHTEHDFDATPPNHRLGRGELALLPADAGARIEMRDATGIVAEVNATFLRARSKTLGPLGGDPEPRLRAPYVDPLTQQLMLALAEDGHSSRPTRRTFEDALICRLLEPLRTTATTVANARGGLAPWQLQRVRAHLHAHLADELVLPELAVMVDLSPSHFARAFKQSTGLPPYRWMAHTRIEKAKSLMIETGQPLVEVALNCGFSDQSAFTKAFTRAIGLSPGAWRRLRRT